MRWVLAPQLSPPKWLQACVQKSGFRPEIQSLLLRFPFQNPSEYEAFLSPSLKNIEPPEAIRNLIQAVQKLHRACQTSKRIAMVSDYDVDGITSMALMHRFFSFFHFSFTPIFPSREQEGYGLTEALVQRILQHTPTFDLLVAMDCGTNSIQPVQTLRAAGIEVLVIDHHQHTQAELPNAICVNPHTQEAEHSTSSLELCTAGLVFKMLHAWLKQLRQENIPMATSLRLRSFLDLVALGTVADLVPLQHDNRLFVYFGLQELPTSPSQGLQELFRCSSYDRTFPLTTEAVSFQFAPRINAGGRLDTANLPFQLLIETDPCRCCTLAQTVEAKNTERKEIERTTLAEAEAMIAQRPPSLVYVLYQPHWHLGVVGIVAGHLTRKYHRPVFVLGQQKDIAKGSGRSIPEVNLVDLFQKAAPYVLHWGGHPAAAGLSVTLENLPRLETCLHNILSQQFLHHPPEPTLPIASFLPANALQPDFFTELERLAPFGQGNEMPIFAVKKIIVTHPTERFGKQGNHLRIRWDHYVAIGWGMGSECIPLHQPIDCALRLGWSYWQNQRSLQIQLLDWRKSQA